MRYKGYPPGPKPKPIIGYLFDLYRDPLGFTTDMANEYGDIVYFKLVYRNAFLLNDPHYIQDVLVNHYGNFTKGPAWQRGKGILGEGLLTSEGDFHRRQRRLTRPAFHRQRIAEFAGLMTDSGSDLVRRWKKGETIDVSREMYGLTLTIVAKTLFGAEVESETEEISEALTIFREEWWRTMWLPNLPFYQYITKLPLPTFRRFDRARDRLDATIYRIIGERRSSGRDQGDLLSMLLLAHDEEGKGDRMTDLQARDELMTIFLAGHETTAASLTWTWYLISQHPEVEEKLHSELESVLGGRIPTFDDLGKLEYTRMVFAETLRLYPPVWMTTRMTLRDYELGPYVIPPRSLIFVSPYVMHRNPNYYDEPLRFDPERWSDESKSELPTFAYFPFGGGPRHCLGEQFAWMEAILMIATIAQNWRLKLRHGHPVEPEPYVTLRSKYGMLMELQERNPEVKHQESCQKYDP